MRALRALLVVFVVSVVLAPTRIHADGVRVKRVIGLDGLVKKSGLIFSATILATDHQRASRMAYGREQEYIGSFRFKVAVDAILRGRLEPKPANPIWISHKGDYPPGKWVLIEEAYRSAFAPRGAKVGDRVIVFLRQGALQDPKLTEEVGETAMNFADEIERHDKLAEVKREVAKAGNPVAHP